MIRKTKKPKTLLPKKLAPLCAPAEKSYSNNSTLKNGHETETLPLSSTMIEGKPRSAREITRTTEERSKIRKNNEKDSKHQFNSVVQTPEIKQNVVPSETGICESVKRHKIRCPECNGSAIDPVTTESNNSENGNGRICSSFRQDISQVPSQMRSNLKAKVSGFTSQRYYLRKRKVLVPIQKESEFEDVDSTLKSNSENELNSELGNGRQSSGAEVEIAYCEWLTQHKLACSTCEAGRNAGSLVQDAISALAEKQTHTSGAAKRFECTQCGKSFGRRDCLNRHKAIHQGERHSCSTCKKFFIRLDSLKRHQQTVHEGRRDYICSTCGIGFGKNGNLHNHLSTVHEGKRDHICSTCGAAFGHKSNLAAHERIVHQGRKDHICTTCGKAFGHKGNFTKHMATHGNERPFPCTGCHKKFNYKADLKRHIADAQ